MSDMVRVTYVGPGVAPPDMQVTEAEANDLLKSEYWEKSSGKKKEEKAEEVNDG